jgi:DNA polymerase-3 subunit delta'
MPQLVWKKLIGQERVKDVLCAAFANHSFGHAYLFAGAHGTGGLAAALEFGNALLCDGAEDVPCCQCDSCRQILMHNHPDLHLVLPLGFQKEHRASDGKLNETGWAFIADSCRQAINDPYLPADSAGMPSIPVEWIREVNHAIQRGSVKGRRNVVCIAGVDLLNVESANAMLKTLEEPPADTVILLVTERLQAVLPTLISRCQILRLGFVPQERIVEALGRATGLDAGDPRLAQAGQEALGSYTRARQLIEQPLDACTTIAGKLWDLSVDGDWLLIGPALDEIVEKNCGHGRDYHAAESILIALLHRVRAAFLEESGAKYISGQTPASEGQRRTIGAHQAETLLTECQKAIAAIRGWGNIQMVLVTVLFTMTEILHEQKHQPR